MSIKHIIVNILKLALNSDQTPVQKSENPEEIMTQRSGLSGRATNNRAKLLGLQMLGK